MRKDIDGVYYINYAAALVERFDRKCDFPDFLATHKKMIESSVVLGLDQPLRVRGITDSHSGYLPWHRERVFNVPQQGEAG